MQLCEADERRRFLNHKQDSKSNPTQSTRLTYRLLLNQESLSLLLVVQVLTKLKSLHELVTQRLITQ